MKKILPCIILFLALMLGFSGPVSSQRTSTIKAVNDTVDLYPGIPVTIDLTANDTIPAADTVLLTGGAPLNCSAILTAQKTATVYTYTSGLLYNGICTGRYLIRVFVGSSVDTSSAWIFFRFHDNSFDSLYLNNINAQINVMGGLFHGIDGPRFEVPKFGGKSTLFTNTLWIGGLCNDTVLYLAAERYGQGPESGAAWTNFDFRSGPVMDSAAYSISQDTAWGYVWNVSKSEVDYHIAHWNDAGYQPVHDILSWPGNGNVSLGQAAKLAPFFDRNNDGIYNPYGGDYPLIRGDQSLFFIMNDDRADHTESLGRRMKVEVHGMAYAWDIPGDSAFNNTIFLNYKIYNRSDRTYSGSYIGVFTDPDIGYAQDDYIGCDVPRGSFIGYNGTPVDGNGEPIAYGANPPVQSITILAGPYMDPDGTDNPKVDSTGKKLCNESVNGTGFGDTIVDNERYGMRKFLYFNNSLSGVPAYMQDPDYAPEYYDLMKGIWKDGTQMIYGGNGHPSAGGYGPACDFMFPGTSDTLNWGAGCQPPNGPVNWTETTASNNPSDRRGVASMGPFTFHPGDIQELDVAYTFARSYDTTQQSSMDKLNTFIDLVRNAYKTNTLSNGQSFNGISNSQQKSTGHLNIFPNPANSRITVGFMQQLNSNVTIRVISTSGKVAMNQSVRVNGSSTTLDISGLPGGVYVVAVSGKDFAATQKLVVLR